MLCYQIYRIRKDKRELLILARIWTGGTRTTCFLLTAQAPLADTKFGGGQIIYCIDIGKIVSLRFPTFWFEPTPQGLFMLPVALGQSKYYSDNLSEDVKRGIRQKLRRGEWPTLAPFGYVNNPKTRTIEPEPTK